MNMIMIMIMFISPAVEFFNGLCLTGISDASQPRELIGLGKILAAIVNKS